jgi:hypothetical protein
MLIEPRLCWLGVDVALGANVSYADWLSMWLYVKRIGINGFEVGYPYISINSEILL